jgi:hypothetical protein
MLHERCERLVERRVAVDIGDLVRQLVEDETGVEYAGTP